MREKTMRLIVTFHTTAEAMATEKLCQGKNLAGKLVSAPRALTADCGIAWSAPAEVSEETKAAITHSGIEVDAFHELLL